MTIGIEKVSKVFFSCSTEILVDALRKLPEKVKSHSWERTLTTGFAYTPTTTLAKKELNGLSCYPPDTARQRDERKSSGSLTR